MTGFICVLLLSVVVTPAWGRYLAPDAPYIVYVNYGDVEIAWNDNIDGEAGWIVQRYQRPDMLTTVVARTEGNVDNFHDTTVAPGQTYYYILCYDMGGPSNSGVSDPSPELMVTTPIYEPPLSLAVLPVDPSGLHIVGDPGGNPLELAWTDNTVDDASYQIQRKGPGEADFSDYRVLPAHSNGFTDTGVITGGTYSYRVYCTNTTGNSGYSNVVTATISGLTNPAAIPAAPTYLHTTSTEPSRVSLAWSDNATDELNYHIERRGPGETAYTTVASGGIDLTSYDDITVAAGSIYYYRVCCTNDSGISGYSNELTVAVPSAVIPEMPGVTTLIFHLGNTTYYVNGETRVMDAAPYATEDRTLLPIRFAVEPLGAVVSWNGSEEKGTINFNGKTIELWLNNNTARVNGVSKQIDPDNANVKPLAIPPGRIMMPLRFITENMGCTVNWDVVTGDISVVYNPAL